MTPDSQLLRNFVHGKSQEAFTELVRRHLDLVYSAALRTARSPQSAEEISQSVFTDLARAADKLKPDTILTAWLYQVTRRTAIDVVRRESRRQARERIAVEMAAMNTATDWTHIEPLLDEAMETLDETDRAAILLRYFENQSLREVGQNLGTSDDAAQKRVSRAVEKLREAFAKNKITIGAGSLGILISANAVQAAPAGLATKILAATPGMIATAGITAIQKIFIAGFAAVAVGAGIYSFHLKKQIAALQGQQTSLNQQIAQMGQERQDAKSQLATTQRENEQQQNNRDELLRLRGEIGVLRRQLDETTKTNRALPAAIAATNTNSPAPQITIKARFLTMPKDTSAGWYDSTSAGILTSENFSIALKQLHSRNDVKIFAEPGVVTISGHQVQMRATENISVVTNFCLQETNGTSSIVPQAGAVECGPILNAIPKVLSDGYTIRLPVIASTVEFLGYAPSAKTTAAYNSAGQEFDVPTVSPQFFVQQTTNSVDMLDGQTLVFRLNDDQMPSAAALAEPDGSKSTSLNRHLLVFLTASIIDAGGNLVHPDARSYTNIPPQPASQ